jgi:hypothetical protein
MDETRCMVKSLLRLSYFYYEESCGQCTPCREGTGWLYRVVNRIEHGKAAGRSGPAELGGRKHHGPHHLRARRCGGDAGSRACSSTSATSSSTTSSTNTAWSAHNRRPHAKPPRIGQTWLNMVEIEIDGKKVEVRKAAW